MEKEVGVMEGEEVEEMVDDDYVDYESGVYESGVVVHATLCKPYRTTTSFRSAARMVTLNLPMLTGPAVSSIDRRPSPRACRPLTGPARWQSALRDWQVAPLGLAVRWQPAPGRQLLVATRSRRLVPKPEDPARPIVPAVWSPPRIQRRLSVPIHRHIHGPEREAGDESVLPHVEREQIPQDHVGTDGQWTL